MIEKDLKPMNARSDGSSADYYLLPKGATQLQDLISHRNMNAQIGEIFRACYRYGIASHSDQLRDAKKILFYAHAEVKRLEREEAERKEAECRVVNEECLATPAPDTPVNPAIDPRVYVMRDFILRTSRLGKNLKWVVNYNHMCEDLSSKGYNPFGATDLLRAYFPNYGYE